MHFPKPKFAPKKVHGHCLVVAACLIHYSFLNPGKPLHLRSAQQIDEMHQKLQCLQQALVNRKDPILLHDNAQLHVTQPMLQKLNELGYKILPHPSYSSDLLPTITSSSISTTFCRENPSTTSRRQKKLLKSLLNPEAWIFMPQE